ncbi:hypothetical protein BD626DRAFT_11463 [Schizophyllum amplum]|uniref:Uncharacterized protein n=1 Tax=Schizophyllum amplum TaxID=97359 RepID=A0A550CX80_9AGAR|nr:hypothetical protein BD626DRAFT_11463 [Auriculariopsis ampla]
MEGDNFISHWGINVLRPLRGPPISSSATSFMEPAQKLSLGPQGLLNEDDNYTLQHRDIYNLAKYVQTGVSLPVDEDAYRVHLGLSRGMAGKLSSVIRPLVTAYDIIQDHCLRFRNVIYPSIIWLSDEVNDYARNAGGTRYSRILRSVRALASAASQADEAKHSGTINRLVETQVSAILNLKRKAQQVVIDLRTFEDQTMRDQSALRERSDAVNARLTQEQGSIGDIRSRLKDLRDELSSVTEQYEQAKIVACTTLTYAWIFPVGLIVAAAMAGVNGDKAVKLASRITKVRDLVTDNEGKVDLDKVLALIEPAIDAIQKMMGVWDSIASDLEKLKNMDARKAALVIADIVEYKVLEKWRALSDAVDRYKQAARMPELEHKSLGDLSKELEMSSDLRSQFSYMPQSPLYDAPETRSSIIR